MRKDVGPYTNVGFGVPPQQGVERSNTGGGSNFIQKSLEGHPVMRFFTIAAASAVGMFAAGKVVREGGLRLAEYASEAAHDVHNAERAARWSNQIHSFRRIESMMDDLQGLGRTYADPEDELQLVKKRELNAAHKRVGRLIGDETVQADSLGIRTSEMDGDPELTKWTMRNEVQRRLLAQARRLPYEAPGFYIADKAIIQPIMGQNQDPKNKVNWKNPVDVVGDFAYQTIKNLAINIMPFDLGFGVAKTGYRNYAREAMLRPSNHLGFLTTQQLLKQVGVEGADLLDKTIKMSEQTLGAFSETINQASASGKTFSEFIRSRSTDPVLTVKPEYANAHYARRLWMQTKAVFKNENGAGLDALSTMPGPFRGMAPGLSTFRKSFKELGTAHDDWQNLLQGKTNFNRLTQERHGAERVQNLKAYMLRGGSSSIEQYGAKSFAFGQGGPLLTNGRANPSWTSGEWHQFRVRDTYKEELNAELARITGLNDETVVQFTNMFGENGIKPYSKNRYKVGDQLAERFQFSRSTFFKEDNDWWDFVTAHATKHVEGFDPKKMDFKNFKKAVKQTDQRFSSPGFKGLNETRIEGEWDFVHRHVLPQSANQTIKNAKKPYNMFTGAGLEYNRDFMLRRTAQRLGIRTIDDAGNELGMDAIKTRIFNRGLDPDNLAKIRGFLIDKKEIRNPWGISGGQSIGWRSLTVDEAVRGDFFGARSEGERKEIEHFIRERTHGPLGGRGRTTQELQRADSWDLKMNRIYIGPNGKIFNLDRVFARALNFSDTIASDFHTPLVQLNPMQLLGHSTTRSMRNRGAFIYAPGQSAQAIAMNSGGEKPPSFYLWQKISPNKSKGHVVGITSDIFGGISQKEYRGIYRPFSTDSSAMAGRIGNIYLKSRDTPSSETQTGWKKLFRVATNQENNLFGGKNSATARWWNAITNKPDSVKNEYKLAKLLSSKDFDVKNISPEQAQGFENLFRGTRQSTFSRNVIEKIVGNKDKITELGLDAPDELLPDLVSRVLNEDLQAMGNTPEALAIRRLQSNLKAMLRQSNDKPWNLSAATSAQTLTISRRIDVFRGEFYKYLLAKPGNVNSGLSGESVDVSIQEGIGQLNKLFRTGQISAAERAEGRVAFLSLQFEKANNEVYAAMAATDVQRTALTQNRLVAQSLFGAEAPNADLTRELLGEFGDYRAHHTSSKFGAIRRQISKFSAQTPYEKPYQVSATGASTSFVPTMATAFENNPRKALEGILGLNWQDPAALSSGVLPMAHMVTRLNRYFETFGLGVDPYAYKGPLDMFARGMVGGRVLPMYAAGAGALAIDRTAGGLVNDRDEQGNRVYSPLVLGWGARAVVAGQVGLAGAIPGGQTGSEKKEELLRGEVPIRAGRYWALGSTPFKGGRIQYFRPSWYRRLQAGASYTPEMHETPMEKLLFGYDFSPLRPLDPYRREREDYETRPYPLTGDYFTGPWGPLNSALNATVGRVLKPRRRMHEEEEKYSLGLYNPVGDAGAYFPQSQPYSGGQGGFGSANQTQQVVARALGGINSQYSAAAGGRTPSSSPLYSSMGLSAPRGIASQSVRSTTTQIAQSYSSRAGAPASRGYPTSYGVPVSRGMMSPRVISSEPTVDYGTAGVVTRRFAYQSQELAGIYGFGTAAIREGLGFGSKDLTPPQGVLEPASRGYSASRSFWNLNLGGLGDLPLPIEGRFSNLELSEIVRRFVPKEPAGINYINNIPNQMGKQFPWLPGADYPLANLKAGDPYNAITDAEIRLPGTGYARTHDLYPDQYGGALGLANVHDILGDVAPWSQQYKAVDAAIQQANLDPIARAKITQTRNQVEAMRTKYEFTPYEHRYDDPSQIIEHPLGEAFGKSWEWLAHRDTYLNTKLGAPRTAVEDWERNDVYGATFPKWETPISSFLKPSVQKATQRNPILAALAGGTLGTLFGSSPEARRIGAVVGGATTLASSLYGHAYEAVTGDRFIPLERRKQLALEENVDLLSYVRSQVGAAYASSRGDAETAALFAAQGKKTMYGADLNGTPEQLAMAIPDRKREHFRAMLYAPAEERERILSTAPRLERRIFQAAWGMPVEEKPDLNQYFREHELPPPDSEIWSPQMNMDTIKIKMGQSIGLDMSQMGFYPQQIQEANYLNPTYPSMQKKTSRFSIAAQLRRLMFEGGIDGSVIATPSAFSGDRIQLNAGVY